MRPCPILLLTLAMAWGQANDPSKARQLEANAKLFEAFRAYLSLPDSQYRAAQIARSHATEYLGLTEPLLKTTDPSTRALLLLIRGDLLLSTGDRNNALAAYREVSAIYAKRTDYPLELQQPPSYASAIAAPRRSTHGPGSHRDNWLIRRFVALESWPDADAEFDRMWNIHRARQAADADFSAALQFTLDDSFYLRRRGQPDRAIAVLQEQILRLDLDRSPVYPPSTNQASSAATAGNTPAGFLEIAYGEIVEMHREGDLLATLKRNAQPAMRRVAAWVLLRQGQADAALAQELEYIDAGSWNGASKAIRRGAIYEAFKRPADAVSSYNQALAGTIEDLNVPASEPVIVAYSLPNSTVAERRIRSAIEERIGRLQAALGNPEGEVAALSSLLKDDNRVGNLEWLQRTAERFQSLGRTAQFEQLLRAQLPQIHFGAPRANAHWILGDVAATAQDLAVAETRSYSLDEWKERFSAKGTQQLRILLDALLKAHPGDLNVRLEKLALVQSSPDSAQRIREMEGLLAPIMPAPESTWNRNETLAGIFRAAYRLSRAYESSRQFSKLVDLALRVARGDFPFRSPEKAAASREVVALALQHATISDLKTRFAAALAAPYWAPERAQLERRTAAVRVTGGRDFGWSEKLPAGVRLLASNEDAMALARDDQYVYTGHPWGVAVYDHAGHAVTRVALGHPVFSLAASGNAVWAGTDKGVPHWSAGIRGFTRGCGAS